MVLNRCQVNSNLPECGLFLVNVGTPSAKIFLQEELKIPHAYRAFSPLQGPENDLYISSAAPTAPLPNLQE